jgi:hypothetical protein
MRRRALPKNTEVIMRGEPVLVSGGGTIKALSAEFLFDLQQHWRKSREQVLDDVAKKYPAHPGQGDQMGNRRAWGIRPATQSRGSRGAAGAAHRPRRPQAV